MKDLFKIEQLENEDVFMNPTFSEFFSVVVLRSRGGNGQIEIDYRPVNIETNGMNIKFPCQLFINGEFIDADGGRTIPTINPANENVICEVSTFLAKKGKIT